ncbi:hypothetical protein HBI18_249870 [Parastagonospora nodorum]|nr:hypothetical protein HBI18_249870 [Parastagonospora nodorum]
MGFLKSRREGSMLVDDLRHEFWLSCDLLQTREELGFFGAVVMMHGFAPAFTVHQEVALCGCVVVRDVRRLEVDGVEAADHAVMGEGHLSCNIICGVRCLTFL